MTLAADVSVVIPTRNRVEMLVEAVSSVEQQTLAGVEIVVVDDASIDGTAEYLTRRADRVRSVRLPERSERSAARNVGLATASGRYVLFLDDDDRLVANALGVLREALVSRTGAVAAIGAQVRFTAAGHRRRELHPRRILHRRAWTDALFHWVAQPSRTLFLSDVVRDVGGFSDDVSYGEDWDLWLRVTRVGPIVVVPQVVSRYRAHPAQSETEDYIKHIEVLAERHDGYLSDDERALADRVRRVRHRYYAGHRALTELDAAAAARGFGGAIAAYPRFLLSPIVRPQLLRPLGKALVGVAVGRRGTLAIRRAAARIRAASRRDVFASDRADASVPPSTDNEDPR